LLQDIVIVTPYFGKISLYGQVITKKTKEKLGTFLCKLHMIHRVVTVDFLSLSKLLALHILKTDHKSVFLFPGPK
jgi:hypothetical protein